MPSAAAPVAPPVPAFDGAVAAAPLAPFVPPSGPVTFPLSWLLANAQPAVQYRALVDVARLSAVGPVSNLPYAHPAALALAVAQSPDGVWNRSMLGVPSAKHPGVTGVGTINAVRRLIESGWDRESPPLARARRTLFRLLAQDEDPSYLYEFNKAKQGDDLARRGRSILREAAAAALAQAGYEHDPRLRGAALRMIERINSYLKSPLAQKPWVRVGNKQVLSGEAAPPSIFALTMLAYMPQFRHEHHEAMDRIYAHLTGPMPRQESTQLCGEAIVLQPHLVLGDMLPHRNAVDSDVPFALMWLELMARLGFLRRNENWHKMFERFVDDRDRGGVWHPHKGMAAPEAVSPFVYPYFPLETTMEGESRWVDVTFRVGLIARLSGRPIELV
jgi:hypothetical protein